MCLSDDFKTPEFQAHVVQSGKRNARQNLITDNQIACGVKVENPPELHANFGIQRSDRIRVRCNGYVDTKSTY